MPAVSGNQISSLSKHKCHFYKLQTGHGVLSCMPLYAPAWTSIALDSEKHDLLRLDVQACIWTLVANIPIAKLLISQSCNCLRNCGK